jgi:hypothetical protein
MNTQDGERNSGTPKNRPTRRPAEGVRAGPWDGADMR